MHPPITCPSESATSTSIRFRCDGVGMDTAPPCISNPIQPPILPHVFGLFGGTFDPPHVGHLAVANAAIEQLDIDRVLWVPAGEPWQKAEIIVTDPRHRMAMVRLAAAEDDRFVVDDIEIRRAGPSYTIDTVTELGGRCMLILGTDAAAAIPTWRGGSELLEMVEVAVVPRPGTLVAQVEEALDRSVHALEMPTIELSGTRLRDHVRAGHSPRYLLTDAVCDYIAANDLYR